ncbi:MAG: ribonuclease H [Planctomycetota bacterium]
MTLATDGCCLAATRVGGWAYILDAASLIRPLVRHGGLRRTTNNRAELLAVIKGLEALASPTLVKVVTDSEYVALGITKRLARWKLQGWRAGSGRHRRPLKNADLWKRLDALLANHKVTSQWVRGHAGHTLNVECDQLARAAAEKLQRKLQEEALS